MTILIDGKQTAQELCLQVKAGVEKLKQEHQIVPTLAVILVGEDSASQIYVRNKMKRSHEVGIESLTYTMDKDTSEQQILDKIDELNADDGVQGILIQLPLPDHLNATKILTRISSEKDVDGFHITNIGKLRRGDKNGLVACTPQGCLYLLKKYMGDLTGKHAVIVGRSNIVGKPMSSLLLSENCTVTIVHSKTEDIKSHTLRADILVVAVGKAQLIDDSWVKEGATVIDVGIHRITTENGKHRLVGDVDFDKVFPKAGAITPVPGGVGPMTIACLMMNTLQSAQSLLKAKNSTA